MSQAARMELDVHQTLRSLWGKVSQRKWRLFACGCCRQAWTSGDARGLPLVEAAERVADERATEEEVRAAVLPAHPSRSGAAVIWAWEMLASLRPGEGGLLHHVEVTIDHAARALRDAAGQTDWRKAQSRQAALLADLLGDPNRPVAIEPSWLAWDEGTVAKMARAIYEEHRFGDLPILADALEEAGCRDGRILDHCRRRGEHARGCWLIDLLLGKE
jgi:hypothetical protein